MEKPASMSPIELAMQRMRVAKTQSSEAQMTPGVALQPVTVHDEIAATAESLPDQPDSAIPGLVQSPVTDEPSAESVSPLQAAVEPLRFEPEHEVIIKPEDIEKALEIYYTKRRPELVTHMLSRGMTEQMAAAKLNKTLDTVYKPDIQMNLRRLNQFESVVERFESLLLNGAPKPMPKGEWLKEPKSNESAFVKFDSILNRLDSGSPINDIESLENVLKDISDMGEVFEDQFSNTYKTFIDDQKWLTLNLPSVPGVTLATLRPELQNLAGVIRGKFSAIKPWPVVYSELQKMAAIGDIKKMSMYLKNFVEDCEFLSDHIRGFTAEVDTTRDSFELNHRQRYEHIVATYNDELQELLAARGEGNNVLKNYATNILLPDIARLKEIISQDEAFYDIYAHTIPALRQKIATGLRYFKSEAQLLENRELVSERLLRAEKIADDFKERLSPDTLKTFHENVAALRTRLAKTLPSQEVIFGTDMQLAVEKVEEDSLRLLSDLEIEIERFIGRAVGESERSRIDNIGKLPSNESSILAILQQEYATYQPQSGSDDLRKLYGAQNAAFEIYKDGLHSGKSATNIAVAKQTLEAARNNFVELAAKELSTREVPQLKPNVVVGVPEEVSINPDVDSTTIAGGEIDGGTVYDEIAEIGGNVEAAPRPAAPEPISIVEKLGGAAPELRPNPEKRKLVETIKEKLRKLPNFNVFIRNTIKGLLAVGALSAGGANIAKKFEDATVPFSPSFVEALGNINIANADLGLNPVVESPIKSVGDLAQIIDAGKNGYSGTVSGSETITVSAKAELATDQQPQAGPLIPSVQAFDNPLAYAKPVSGGVEVPGTGVVLGANPEAISTAKAPEGMTSTEDAIVQPGQISYERDILTPGALVMLKNEFPQLSQEIVDQVTHFGFSKFMSSKELQHRVGFMNGPDSMRVGETLHNGPVYDIMRQKAQEIKEALATPDSIESHEGKRMLQLIGTVFSKQLYEIPSMSRPKFLNDIVSQLTRENTTYVSYVNVDPATAGIFDPNKIMTPGVIIFAPEVRQFVDTLKDKILGSSSTIATKNVETKVENSDSNPSLESTVNEQVPLTPELYAESLKSTVDRIRAEYPSGVEAFDSAFHQWLTSQRYTDADEGDMVVKSRPYKSIDDLLAYPIADIYELARLPVRVRVQELANEKINPVLFGRVYDAINKEGPKSGILRNSKLKGVDVYRKLFIKAQLPTKLEVGEAPR